MPFDPAKFIDEKTEELRRSIPGKAIIAVSGGVDSTTAAVLAARALGKDLLAVFVDTGFMRKGEGETVTHLLSTLKVNHRVVDASAQFFKALEGATEPEVKRLLIGRRFIEVFEEEADRFGAQYLIQGTIAPDWIESGDQARERIKAHHNVAGLPKEMRLKVVEPLRDLYKDEVRRVARALAVSVSERQPFPGPGLAVRCLGEVTPAKVAVVREACAIVEEEMEEAQRKEKLALPWQYFAVLLPVRSVGVKGDIRAYGYTVAIRAVDSVDGMTATFAPLPFALLERISSRITNEIPEVNRVVYDVTNKPPGTIEWE